jgi:hypothetical protein
MTAYTAPDRAHSEVRPTPTGYVVRFGYLSQSGEVFYPSAVKLPREYQKRGAAESAALAWVS